MKKHQTNNSSFLASASLPDDCCACDKDKVTEELQQLRMDTEKALKASWDETESLQNECNSRLHQFIRLEVELKMMHRNESASKVRINDLEKQKKNILQSSATSNPTGQHPSDIKSCQTETDVNKRRRATWPSLPIFKNQRDERDKEASDQIHSLVQTIASRDREIQEKQRILEESLEMIKRASNGIL